jgi:hypothetical protein|tara:strand:+ start:1292 stop:1603 length:312 start_codon:yes stop_codon:yes gene_type:complete
MKVSNKSIESAVKSICKGFDYYGVTWQDRIYLRDHFKKVVLSKRMDGANLVTFDEKYPTAKNMKITRYSWPISDSDNSKIEQLNNRHSTYVAAGYVYYLSWDV